MFKSLLLASAAVLALQGAARADVHQLVGTETCEPLYVVTPDGLTAWARSLTVTNDCTPSRDDPTIGARELSEYVSSAKVCAARVAELILADPDSHPGCKVIAGKPFKDLNSR